MRHSIVGFAALAAIVNAQEGFKIGATVKTTSGEVTGQASKWKPEVSEYLGIPFAQPPIGELRWAAPQPFKNEGKSIQGTKYGPSCVAPRRGLAGANASSVGGATNEQSEDCLYVNVWTKPQTGEKKKAVLVWIYGGAFVTGSGANPTYNGANLADEGDVVTVNLNYRLGVFGFPGMPFLPDENVGLQDQRLALEWVRDNIEAFGGDKHRITLYGQSAGGASVDYYAYAWTKDPIVNGFIPQSGTTSTMSFGPPNNVAAWYKASQKLGCGGKEAGEKTLACLRGKSAVEVLEATVPPPSTSGVNFGDFLPKPDGKVVFTPAEYTQKLAKGDFIKKPVLIGNTENEMAMFMGAGASALLSTKDSQLQMSAVFSCPAGKVAEGRSKYVPVWRYSYAGEYPNQKLSSGVTGPYHGSEIGLVMGTDELTRGTPDIPEQVALGKKIRQAWLAFAKNPEKGLDGIWPRYGYIKDESPKWNVIVLGGKNSSDITYKAAQEYDLPCETRGNAR